MARPLTRPLAIFRADASPGIGGGHVRRSMVLADALALEGWRCRFATRKETARTVPHLSRAGYDVFSIGNGDDAGEIRQAAPQGCELLVVDHYGLDAAFESSCRGWAKRILVIDDLADRAHDCDVLLDQSAGRREADYASLAPEGCRILAGAHFALLSPAFAKSRAAALARREAGDPARILVSFGMADQDNLTSLALAALARLCGAGLAVDVVLGAAAPHLAAVREAAVGHRLPVALHVDPPDMTLLTARADIAIGAAGVSAWERCCLGLPAVVIVAAGNQRTNARALARSGAALVLGAAGEVGPDGIAAAVDALLQDPERRRAMSSAAAALCDGLGARRVLLEAVAPPLAQDGRPVRLRPATLADRDFMLAWQRAPGARAYSGTPEAPRPADHGHWLKRKLADPGCVLNIVLHGSEPAGVLRYDLDAEGRRVVSILIAAGSQGKGVASAALALGRRLLPDDLFLATVHAENRASVALFRRAGFVQHDATTYLQRPGANSLVPPLAAAIGKPR